MVRLSVLAFLAASFGPAAAQRRNCPANYDVCGWSLTGTYGYAQDDLVVAATDGGVGISAAYDSVYNCDGNGAISFSVQCGSGACNAGVDGRTSAACQGTTAADQGDQEGDDGSDTGDDGSNNAGSGGDALTPDAPLTTFVTTTISRPTRRV